MPRYIDAEHLMEKVSRMIDYCEKNKDKKFNALDILFQVGDAIIDSPTAEVAREIFEEIDLVFRNYYAKCSGDSELKLLEPIRQGERFIINEMWREVAELKKKYTED